MFSILLNPLISLADDEILDKKITLTIVEKKVADILETIEQLTDASFAYDAGLVPVEKIISIHVTEQPLRKVLDQIINDKSLNYKALHKQIIIYRPIALKVQECNTETQKILKGKVIDKFSRNPLSYAHISIAGQGFGTISNDDGEFIFNIPDKYFSSELSISYIGYNSYKQKLDSLKTDSLFIVLEPATTIIDEIVAKPVDPFKLIKKALSQIPQNYSTKPVMQTAFFREAIKKDTEYVSISEALLNINKTSYTRKYVKDQVKLIKGRKSPDVKSFGAIGIKVAGGPYNIVNLDVVKNRINFIRPEYFSYYQYKYEGKTRWEGNETFIVSFDQKDDIKQAFFKGEIYIDATSYAIVRVIFELSPKGIKYSKELFVEKTPSNVTTLLLKAKYTVDYGLNNNVWNLKTINGINCLLVISHKYSTVSTFFTESVLTITEQDDKIIKFRPNEIFKASDVLVEEVGIFDESYWEKQNIIKPTFLVRNGIYKCRKM
jgi:hypothetical protein